MLDPSLQTRSVKLSRSVLFESVCGRPYSAYRQRLLSFKITESFFGLKKSVFDNVPLFLLFKQIIMLDCYSHTTSIFWTSLSCETVIGRYFLPIGNLFLLILPLTISYAYHLSGEIWNRLSTSWTGLVESNGWRLGSISWCSARQRSGADALTDWVTSWFKSRRS